MAERLTEREGKILYAVINEYIHTATPIGSQTIADTYDVGLSPASVRNIMALLEEKGYLMQPHTSAGRVPTERGFRFYVDTYLKKRNLNRREKERIRSSYNLERLDVEEVVKETSRVLSLFSHYLGVVLAPKLTHTSIKRFELISVKKNYILVILISSSGIIYKQLVKVEEEFGQEDLDRMANFLNSFASGLTLREVKKRVVEEMRKEKNLVDRLLMKALEIGKATITDAEKAKDVYIEGRSNILSQPEFRDLQKMEALLKAVEEKGAILKILDQCLKSKGLQIFIGSENPGEEIRTCTIIAAPYGTGEEVLGTLGVIGPIRMDYERIIPLVEYTAALVGNMISMEEMP